MITRFAALAALLTLAGCDELNALALHRSADDAGVQGTTPICTRANSIDDAAPAEQRCLEAHCYSNNHAPAQTAAQALHRGDGEPQQVPINWHGIEWSGTLPDHSSSIAASGSGCYDCASRPIGHVSHRVTVDDVGVVGFGLPVNAIDFECALLSRPAAASVQVTGLQLVANVEECLRAVLGNVPDRHEFPAIIAWDLGFSWIDGASPLQRARLGVCLANVCADMNTFAVDRDGDGVGDVCDNCGNAPNPNQSNVAGAWHGDVCDDTDADTIGDATDNCVFATNPDQGDIDNNGIGDHCDDQDGDGTVDADDACPERAGPCQDDYSDDFGACEVSGSIVGVESQTLGETVDLPGTGLYLRYASQRVPGFHPSGAPQRDARQFGFGGWSLNAQHHWEAGDPPRVLLGSGSNFPATRRFAHADGELIPDPSDAIAYVFDGAHRHVQTLDALNGRVLLRFEYAGADLTAIVDADGQRVDIERPGDDLVLTGPLGDVNQLSFDDNGYLGVVTQPGERRWEIAHDDDGLLATIAPPRVAAGGGSRHTFRYNLNGQLISDYGIDGERLRLNRSGAGAVSQVDLYRTLDVEEDGFRELNHTYVSRLDGTRFVQFAGQRTTARPLEGADLEGFDSGSHTRDAHGGSTTVLIDDGDRWAGGISRGRTRFTPPDDVGLGPIRVDTEERVVLADNGPLGEHSVALVETTISTIREDAGDAEDAVIQAQARLYPTGDGVRFNARPFIESTSPEGRHSVVVMQDGRVSEVQAGELYPVRYTYDARGRVETILEGPDGAERLTEFEYDDEFRFVIATHPNGRQILTRLNEALDVDLVVNMAPTETELTFDYDDGGALSGMTTPSGEHTWTVSEGGRLKSYTAPPVLGQPDGSTTQYAWTRDGRPTVVIEADGRETGFVYADETGQLTKVNTPTETITQRWRGDLQPEETRLSRRTLMDGTTIDLTAVPLYRGSRIYGETLKIRMDGQLSVLQQSVEIDRTSWVPKRVDIKDAALRSQETVVHIDRDGVLTRMGAMTIHPSVHGVGLPGTVEIGDMQTERVFSRFAEMDTKRIEHAGDHRYLLELERDARSGEVTGWRECFGAGGCNEWTFEFDANGRLTTATPTVGDAYDYEYDQSGRRTLRTHGGAREVPEGNGFWEDAQDRLHGYSGATFGYNRMGQRVRAVDTPTGDWAYDYDVSGGLRQVDGDRVSVEYVLDSSGRRIARREDGGPLTWWMYAGLHPVAEFDANLHLRKRFYYGVNGHVPEYMTTHGDDGDQTGRYHFVTNLVGSVVGVLDDGGEWVERTNYSPFGRPEVVIAAPEALRHPFGFAGGMKDEATGLVRFGARDYDPFTGQWLAKDPIRFAGGDSNLYGYVGNDPVRFFDPSGLFEVHAGADFSCVGFSCWSQVGPTPPGVVAVTRSALLEVVSFAAGGVALKLVAKGYRAVKAWRAARKAKKAAACAEKAAELGKLRSLGPNQWESTAGLRYGSDPRLGNRVRHVLKHAVDAPGRRGVHGVFDAGRQGALKVIDEAWQLAKTGGTSVTAAQQGARTVYNIDMGRRIGFVGGQAGAAAGNPAAQHIRLVVSGARDVITAFPY